MGTERIHRAVSPDGTEIVGHVHGQGQPLVLLHGRVEDGETSWARLLPHLPDGFAYFLPSTRGRGLSGDHPDHTPARLLEDVVGFVDSIGEPVGVAGWSSGAGLALGAAARTPAAAAVVAYEPSVSEVLEPDDVAQLGAAMGHVVELAEAGRLTAAARSFLQVVATDDELAAVPDDHFEAMGRYVPVALQEVQQTHLDESDAPKPTAPAALERITAPVLALHGERTPWAWFAEGARHVARHVATAQVRELAGVGHLAPIVAPKPLADELARFFDAALEPT